MKRAVFLASSAMTLVLGTGGFAQDVPPTYSLYGTPGLLEMPVATTAEEGTLAGTLSYRDGLFQTVLNYQLTDRLSGTMRYSIVDLYNDLETSVIENELERGFDLKYQLVEEGTYAPAIAVGLRDFLTPGRFQSEYIVATKSFGDSLTVTGGIGWGEMGTEGGFDNPISSRADRPVFDEADPDGQLGSDYWFTGDAAFFGGLEYQINDRWGVLAEYSSIAYDPAPNAPAVSADSPYSFGVTYRPRDAVQLSFAALNGQELAISGSFFLNANNRPSLSGFEAAPVPINARSASARQATTWDRNATPEAALRSALTATLAIEGLTLTGMEMTDRTARVRFINTRYRSNAQAMGRAARMMTQVMPGAIEVFVLEAEAQGIGLSAVTVNRSDLEALENRPSATATLFANTAFAAAGDDVGLTSARDADAALFLWGVSPYLTFDPSGGDGDLSVDAGLRLDASYQFSPQLILSGAVLQSALRFNAEDPDPDSTPDLQNVRSDRGFYGDDGVPVLESLALAHFGRPGGDIYSRVSVGYLERMFGGISTELLWKPVDSRFGLGAEMNYVAQRDSDMGFGFDEYEYETATGHLSAYYDFGNGYHTQVDLGRYLAGDWGATLRFDREYDNGVRVGAYVSQTDTAHEDFGDGSYNKGIVIAIPQDFLTGQPNRDTYGTTLRTRTGDGGARLNVDGRLYGVVRDAHQADLSDTWGRFWR
ncbi:YjbH domain-containing protein [Loktanella sp. Alg231-35]|uniref:YjbH domain-containing protein n=1 Tax=Loktanella sp. Alg231-35 TaxID=1922220 RepID=UPI000D561B77|nr:YjbH domain-containing protein [Loktanella sp. Alg231-35]